MSSIHIILAYPDLQSNSGGKDKYVSLQIGEKWQTTNLFNIPLLP